MDSLAGFIFVVPIYLGILIFLSPIELSRTYSWRLLSSVLTVSCGLCFFQYKGDYNLENLNILLSFIFLMSILSIVQILKRDQNELRREVFLVVLIFCMLGLIIINSNNLLVISLIYFITMLSVGFLGLIKKNAEVKLKDNILFLGLLIFFLIFISGIFTFQIGHSLELQLLKESYFKGGKLSNNFIFTLIFYLILFIPLLGFPPFDVFSKSVVSTGKWSIFGFYKLFGFLIYISLIFKFFTYKFQIIRILSEDISVLVIAIVTLPPFIAITRRVIVGKKILDLVNSIFFMNFLILIYWLTGQTKVTEGPIFVFLFGVLIGSFVLFRIIDDLNLSTTSDFKEARDALRSEPMICRVCIVTAIVVLSPLVNWNNFLLLKDFLSPTYKVLSLNRTLGISIASIQFVFVQIFVLYFVARLLNIVPEQQFSRKFGPKHQTNYILLILLIFIGINPSPLYSLIEHLWAH